jgi:hypothetical protein
VSLWSGLSLHRGVRPGEAFAVGAARLVSTPSRETFVLRAWLGIATCEGSPTLRSSASPVSRRAPKSRLSPLRLPILPPRVPLNLVGSAPDSTKRLPHQNEPRRFGHQCAQAKTDVGIRAELGRKDPAPRYAPWRADFGHLIGIAKVSFRKRVREARVYATVAVAIVDLKPDLRHRG